MPKLKRKSNHQKNVELKIKSKIKKRLRCHRKNIDDESKKLKQNEWINSSIRKNNKYHSRIHNIKMRLSIIKKRRFKL